MPSHSLIGVLVGQTLVWLIIDATLEELKKLNSFPRSILGGVAQQGLGSGRVMMDTRRVVALFGDVAACLTRTICIFVLKMDQQLWMVVTNSVACT
jgi:hypothetical protein